MVGFESYDEQPETVQLLSCTQSRKEMYSRSSHTFKLNKSNKKTKGNIRSENILTLISKLTKSMNYGYAATYQRGTYSH